MAEAVQATTTADSTTRAASRAPAREGIKPTPPVIRGGLPLIGHIPEFMRDRTALLKRGYAEHGDVFAIRFLPKPAVVVTGTPLNKQFYLQTDRALNIADVYGFLKEAIGEVLFTAGKQEYYNQRPVLTAAFGRDRMRLYLEGMNREVDRWLSGLHDGAEIDLTEEMLALTQYVAAHAFVGPGFREELDDAFWADYDAISRSLDPILPPKLPLPKFLRRDRAKKRIRATFAEMIARRQANPEAYDDLISQLLTTELKDGTIMDRDTVAQFFTGLLFAGHETTAGQAAWTLILLLQHPGYLERVQAELAEQLPAAGEQLDPAVLSKLRHVYWAIDETTRLRPSADMQLRIAEEELEVGGYRVPKGWLLMVNAANSHHVEGTWTDPEAFDPLRFSPERKEGADPFSMVGFGGGIHKCTGMNFAKNEMAIITAKLLQAFDVELLTEDPHVVVGVGANRPSAAWVRLHRRAG